MDRVVLVVTRVRNGVKGKVRGGGGGGGGGGDFFSKRSLLKIRLLDITCLDYVRTVSGFVCSVLALTGSSQV